MFITKYFEKSFNVFSSSIPKGGPESDIFLSSGSNIPINKPSIFKSSYDFLIYSFLLLMGIAQKNVYSKTISKYPFNLESKLKKLS